MEEDKERKQQYLREHILEAGYDADDFVEYLRDQGITEDIDQITTAQLKETVENYCKKKLE